jgi:hypothetical protein
MNIKTAEDVQLLVEDFGWKLDDKVENRNALKEINAAEHRRVSVLINQRVWDETFDDRSIVSESQTGQVLQEYVEPLRNYDFSIPTINRDDLRALQATYLAYGRGAILWIDPETDDLPVMYGRMTDALSASKNRKLYTAQLKFKEAR